MLDPAQSLRLIADELRALAQQGLHFTEDVYDRHRYERVRGLAAELFALCDTRTVDEIESTLMPALTHVAPRPGADAGVLRRHGRILLVQRMDDRLWAMPGGGLEIGETVAEGASRETWEETGVEVRPLALAGVWDSRLCGTRANHHLYQFVVLCEPLDEGAEPGGSNETLGAGWFDPADLPELSPGHALRIQGLLTFVRDRVAFLDL